MVGGTILQKVDAAAVHHHEGQEVNFQDLMVLFSIHCHVRVKEEDTPRQQALEKQAQTIKLAGCLTVLTV